MLTFIVSFVSYFLIILLGYIVGWDIGYRYHQRNSIPPRCPMCNKLEEWVVIDVDDEGLYSGGWSCCNKDCPPESNGE